MYVSVTRRDKYQDYDEREEWGKSNEDLRDLKTDIKTLTNIISNLEVRGCPRSTTGKNGREKIETDHQPTTKDARGGEKIEEGHHLKKKFRMEETRYREDHHLMAREANGEREYIG